MNTRPEALRLADALDAQVEVGGGDLGELEDASAELRRLHEVNQNLLKALNEFVAAADGVNAEPVAEIQTEDMGKPFNAIRVTAHFYAEVPAVGTKLYKAPPKREWVGLTDDEIDSLLPDPDGTVEEDVQRVEVSPGVFGTEYTVGDAWSKSLVRQLARAIEAAHGIGEKE